ncbi:MAG: polysaccharide pyruvyl transferase family protein [Lachnospiraceae bacterium]|nr:polysaccharide pyruvyl transferase family protein [Lachnospiraceae bacterium]
MKKVGIITFHFVNNFGGALQAYALRRFVSQNCDAEAEIIDYRNWFIRLCDRIRLLPVSTNVSEVISGLKTMKARIDRRNKFGHFTKDNNKVTRKYSSHFAIEKDPPKDDKFICGSDQIWNPVITMGVSQNYFLRFVKDANDRIAYAPSFGTSEISKKYEKKISEYISGIGHLSIREKSGAEYIEKLTGQKALRLIDPTFLLHKEEWEKLGKNPLKSDEPYILLYIMQRDEEVYEYAKQIKEKWGIKLVEISRYGYQPGFVDETLISVGPDEFLGLFRDARYVCTNSYHGLAYSIIFEKEFCLIPCKRFRARINNMLDLLHITIGGKDDNWEKMTASYDKEFVREVIEKEREKSLKFLRDSIGE